MSEQNNSNQVDSNQIGSNQAGSAPDNATQAPDGLAGPKKGFGGMSYTEARREILSWIMVIALGLLFAIFMTNFVIVNARVPSESMVPTIQAKDRLIAFRLSYWFSAPKRYDIVVFPFPDDEKQLFIKRIIGLPGETLQVVNGKVYIDGSDTPLPDSFTNGTPTGDAGPFVIPQNCYFMMGDNRNNSNDSRFWQKHFVQRNKILGKAIFQYFPRFRMLDTYKPPN